MRSLEDATRCGLFSSDGWARHIGAYRDRGPLLDYESFCAGEWIDWYDLTPGERLVESARLCQEYLAAGIPLILRPTRKVLSTIQKHGVKALLMGGQACVLYGAVEVTFDTDLAVLVDRENMEALSRALAELQAERIAVPPFEAGFLERGFFVHFRCTHSDARRQRVDIASTMRGVAPFEELWERRAILADEDGTEFAALSLRDLVQSKKTQRDKDWPAIRRLLEADYRLRRSKPAERDIQFWFLEMRTPELLIDGPRFPDCAPQPCSSASAACVRAFGHAAPARTRVR
jgi:hypothetical protein